MSVKIEKKLLPAKLKVFGLLFVNVIFKAIIGTAITPTAEAINDEYHLKVCDK
jgi:hypothetical protein